MTPGAIIKHLDIFKDRHAALAREGQNSSDAYSPSSACQRNFPSAHPSNCLYGSSTSACHNWPVRRGTHGYNTGCPYPNDAITQASAYCATQGICDPRLGHATTHYPANNAASVTVVGILQGKQLHLHSLCHTTAIHLLKAGIDFATISQVRARDTEHDDGLCPCRSGYQTPGPRSGVRGRARTPSCRCPVASNRRCSRLAQAALKCEKRQINWKDLDAF